MERCNLWSGEERCEYSLGHEGEHSYNVKLYTPRNPIFDLAASVMAEPVKLQPLLFSEYVKSAMRTDLTSAQYEEVLARLSHPGVLRLLHAGMGLCTESGEFVDQLKRYLFYGKPIDMTNLVEEVGDLMWYSALAISATDKAPEAVLAGNIAKLFKRYPEKFDEVSALTRNILAETQALEENIT